ncbi:MAG TPA: hypothetical protein VJS11_12530 [Acidobacteriaceae bacterium]|nr:hypothetical protein [Acidobacteriaceae bacterium]
MSSTRTVARWRKFLIAGLAVCLLTVLLHPSLPQSAVVAALVLFPVLIFGLVRVPRSLWPCRDLGDRFALPVFCGAGLFQRPPPSSR